MPYSDDFISGWMHFDEREDGMTTKSFQERQVGDVTILTVEQGLKGPLESYLKTRIDDLVREGRIHIVVDLKLVPYVDSSDIGRIIRAHLSARQAGGRVRLCNLSERVMAVMKMTRLDTVLEIYENEADATSNLRRGRVPTKAAPAGDA
jgi:anti-sigma B factor antagonist